VVHKWKKLVTLIIKCHLLLILVNRSPKEDGTGRQDFSPLIEELRKDSDELAESLLKHAFETVKSTIFVPYFVSGIEL
jgi:hypothetical protein